MMAADIVITDSGGIQEEAPSLGKPVLVMRDVTERPEAVDAGTVKLVGADRARIVSETTALLDDRSVYESMSRGTQSLWRWQRGTSHCDGGSKIWCMIMCVLSV